jgi:hypothetical protein
MAVVHAEDELLEEPTGFIFAQALAFHDVAEHVAAGNVFHDKGEVRGDRHDFLELDDVGVEELLVVHDFTMGELLVLVVPVCVEREREREGR